MGIEYFFEEEEHFSFGGKFKIFNKSDDCANYSFGQKNKYSKSNNCSKCDDCNNCNLYSPKN